MWTTNVIGRYFGICWANLNLSVGQNDQEEISSPNPTLSQGKMVWWTKLNFGACVRFCDSVTLAMFKTFCATHSQKSMDAQVERKKFAPVAT